MVSRLQVRATPRAAAEIRRAAAWWRANRPAAALALVEDLKRAFELVASQPGIGARARNTKKPGVRRLLLSRTWYHLYYQVNADAGRIEILALWHAHRGREPAV